MGGGGEMDSEDIVSEDNEVNSDSQDNAYSAEECDEIYTISDSEATDTSEDSDFLDKELLKNLKKMVMKSMKRKKTHKAKTNGKRKQRVKRDRKDIKAKAADCGSKASSRYNVAYFFHIINSLSEHHRDLISGIGFGSLLEFDGTAAPRSFTQWIADNVNVTTGDICLDNKSIQITPQSVNDVLGIPLNGNEVETESESAKADFLALFGLTEMPTIKYFGTKILKSVLTDDEFVRCFMVVTLSTFLCATSSTKPSTKYLSALIDTRKIKDFDWCKFVHDWTIFYIKKYQKCSRTLGGCLFYLAVRYLDFLDFGTAQLPLTLPRISVWQGEMIKDFCKLDLLKDGKYGKRPVIGDICSMFETYIENKDDNSCSETQNLLLNVMKCLVDSTSFATGRNMLNRYASHGEGNSAPSNDYHQSNQQTMDFDSQSTEKVNCSEENMQNLNNPCNESQSTVKVNSNGSIEKTPLQQVIVKRQQRSSQNHSSSQQSFGSVASHTRSRSMLRERTGKSPLSQLDNSSATNKELETNKGLSCGQSSSLEHMLSQDCCRNSIAKVDNNEAHTKHGDELSPNKSKVAPNGGDNPPHPMFASIQNLGSQELICYNALTSECDANMTTRHNVSMLNSNNPKIGRSHSDPILNKSRVFLKSTSKEGVQNDMCDDEYPSFRALDILDNQFEDDDHVGDHPEKGYNDVHDELYNFGTLIPDDNFSIQCAQRRRSSVNFIVCPEPICVVPPKEETIILSSPDSPEVVYKGEKRFTSVCNDLCDLSDEVYNQSNSVNNPNLASISSSSGKHTSLAPRRFVQPSKYICSSFGDNKTRFSVRSDDHKLYEAIVRLADSEEHMHKFAVNIDNCKLTFSTFGKSMKRRGNVEAYVVNSFCRKLFRDNHPRVSKKHFFFHTMSEYFLEKYPNERKQQQMKENTMKAFDGAGTANQLHQSELLFFPSLYEFHWFLFVVDLRDGKFVFLDSLYGEESIHHKKVRSTIIKNFVNTWCECGLKRKNFANFEVVYPRISKQSNCDDCGIFVMKYMELWNPRNQLVRVFSSNDIPTIRTQLAIEIMFCPYNTMEESKNIVQRFNPRIHGKYARQM